MNLSELFGPGLTKWVVIPGLIFLARICDVSIGTIRMIFVARGMKRLAPLLGFFEVLFWLLAIGQIMQNLTHWFNYIAYGAGFAAGNWVGMVLEGRLALGKVILRVITAHAADDLTKALRQADFGVTSLDAEGRSGPVRVIFVLLGRHDINRAIDIIKQSNPRAFFSIEDVRYVSEGVFHPRKIPLGRHNERLRGLLRKGK